jgi:hypothetical protein
MFAKHPDLAKRFAAETPPGAKLPYHVKDGKGPLARMYRKEK